MIPDAAALYRQALAHPLLAADHERALLARAIEGDRLAIEQLVRCNQRLVANLAMRYYRSGMAGDLEYMDLVQYGNLGLLEAIRRWDNTREGVRFSTYAVWWVRAMIRRNSLRYGTTLTRTAREGDLLSSIRRTSNALLGRLHRCPTTEEIAAETTISLALVEQLLPMLRNEHTLSLDAENSPDNDLTILDRLQADTNTAIDVERSLIVETMQHALATLPDRYRQVIVWRYGLDYDEPSLSAAECARRLNISRTRVQEIERIALRRLRAEMQLPPVP